MAGTEFHIFRNKNKGDVKSDTLVLWDDFSILHKNCQLQLQKDVYENVK